jgi:hypothetical protein
VTSQYSELVSMELVMFVPERNSQSCRSGVRFVALPAASV